MENKQIDMENKQFLNYILRMYGIDELLDCFLEFKLNADNYKKKYILTEIGENPNILEYIGEPGYKYLISDKGILDINSRYLKMIENEEMNLPDEKMFIEECKKTLIDVIEKFS